MKLAKPRWEWLDLWEQDNPNPGGENFEAWWTEKSRMMDRVWVARSLPQFRVWDWPDEEVALARKIVARHVCGVCGLADDETCYAEC